MCCDNSHRLLKYVLGICLCFMLISLLMSQICSKMVTFLFLAYYSGHFCYHSNGKSQINTRLLHLGYCEEIGEKQFSFSASTGVKIAP